MVVQYSQLKSPPITLVVRWTIEGWWYSGRVDIVISFEEILTGVYWYPRREGTWKIFDVDYPGHGATLPRCEMSCCGLHEDLGGGHMRRECGGGRYVHLERVHGMDIAGFRYTVGRTVQRVDSHGIATVQRRVRFDTALDWQY